MGSMKRYIHDHIENSRDKLEPQFMEANAVEFIRWFYELPIEETHCNVDSLIERYIEIERADDFWEFCAEDLNGE